MPSEAVEVVVEATVVVAEVDTAAEEAAAGVVVKGRRKEITT